MNLKELRKQAGKTQEEMANFLNTNQRTYGRYELDQSEPNIETLIKLADYYQVSLDYLVGRDFGNKLGYLSEEEIAFVQTYLSLTESHKNKLLTYALTLLAVQ